MIFDGKIVGENDRLEVGKMISCFVAVMAQFDPNLAKLPRKEQWNYVCIDVHIYLYI